MTAGATTAILLLAAACAALGFAGLVLPGLPGAPLLFAGLWLAAWAEGFAHVGRGTLVALAVLAAATWAVDFAAGALGAKRFGASRRAAAGAAIGAVVGLFLGLPGLVLGPFLGAVLGELSAERGLRDASRAGVGATLGLAIGLAAKMALGVTMIVLFAVDRFVWR
jgi:uncharacterized protein YqgC (DUF456 family)